MSLLTWTDAIYTTLFTATDAELDLFFPGWRRPLPAGRSEAEMSALAADFDSDREWDPGPISPNAERQSLRETKGRPVLPPLVEPTGSGEFLEYERFLEDQAPEALRTFPHWACKSLSFFELQLLGEAVEGEGLPPARLVDCRKDEGFAGAMQEQALVTLAHASEPELRNYVRKWQELLEEDSADDLYLAAVDIQTLAKDAVARGAHLLSFTDLPDEQSATDSRAHGSGTTSGKKWWQFWK